MPLLALVSSALDKLGRLDAGVLCTSKARQETVRRGALDSKETKRYTSDFIEASVMHTTWTASSHGESTTIW